MYSAVDSLFSDTKKKKPQSVARTKSRKKQEKKHKHTYKYKPLHEGYCPFADISLPPTQCISDPLLLFDHAHN